MPPDTYDYIVVGSGAGGGTVAARLAEAGHLVLLLEAGGDPWHMRGGGPLDPDGNRLPEDYSVPVFHALSTENTALKWDFWVEHLRDRPERDPKYYRRYPPDTGPEVNGVWYPRAGALGGCTAHNAMIFVAPHNQDWEDIADLTGDESWRAGRMRAYFEKLEDCRYRRDGLGGANRARHGYGGWLTTEKAIPRSALKDVDLVKMLLSAAGNAMEEIGQPWRQAGWQLESGGDPNDWRLVEDDAVGVRFVPLTTRDHIRVGTRERVRRVEQAHPGKLTVELDALATRVVLDDQQRAVGVDYLKGRRLYRAHAAPSDAPGEVHTAHATREVILAGGAFNTPQLLMLSGIGPTDQLERPDIGIPVQVPLDGVGRNLQDRYEVSVVNRMKQDWTALEGAAFTKHDPLYREWAREQRGVYTTNGAVLSIIARSQQQTALSDLFCFALLGNFRGYYPNYTKNFPNELNYLSWAILKAHTRNRGRVTLASADARDRPRIDFNFFDPANDPGQTDLEAVADGVAFVRRIVDKDKDLKALIQTEAFPGPGVQTRDQIKDWIVSHAWGHHASCTCPIGPDPAQGAVLDSRFRVHGTTGLRVVDASVFPTIPGFFILSSIYMVAEKAAEAILADTGGA